MCVCVQSDTEVYKFVK